MEPIQKAQIIEKYIEEQTLKELSLSPERKEEISGNDKEIQNLDFKQIVDDNIIEEKPE